MLLHIYQFLSIAFGSFHNELQIWDGFGYVLIYKKNKVKGQVISLYFILTNGLTSRSNSILTSYCIKCFTINHNIQGLNIVTETLLFLCAYTMKKLSHITWDTFWTHSTFRKKLWKLNINISLQNLRFHACMDCYIPMSLHYKSQTTEISISSWDLRVVMKPSCPTIVNCFLKMPMLPTRQKIKYYYQQLIDLFCD